MGTHYQYKGKHYILPDGLSKEEAIQKIQGNIFSRAAQGQLGSAGATAPGATATITPEAMPETPQGKLMAAGSVMGAMAAPAMVPTTVGAATRMGAEWLGWEAVDRAARKFGYKIPWWLQTALAVTGVKRGKKWLKMAFGREGAEKIAREVGEEGLEAGAKRGARRAVRDVSPPAEFRGTPSGYADVPEAIPAPRMGAGTVDDIAKAAEESAEATVKGGRRTGRRAAEAAEDLPVKEGYGIDYGGTPLADPQAAMREAKAAARDFGMTAPRPKVWNITVNGKPIKWFPSGAKANGQFKTMLAKEGKEWSKIGTNKYRTPDGAIVETSWVQVVGGM